MGAITKKQLNKLMEPRFTDLILRELDLAMECGHHVIDYQHPHYPPSLKRSTWSYPLLYFNSPYSVENLAKQWKKIQIGIIGTRSPSLDAHDKINDLLSPLTSFRSQIQVISGLAMGVDRYSHQVASDSNIECLAVLGQGLSTYKQQSEWERQVHLCSMFPPNQNGSKRTYPMRNQVLAGLSDGLVILEAKKRSGTMITYQQALEDGIPIWAHTGNWKSENSQGPIQVLRMGGIAIQNGTDLIDDFEIQFPQYSWALEKKIGKPILDPTEKLVYLCLQKEPLTVLELGSKTNLNSRECFSILGRLEAKSWIRFNWNGKWSLMTPSLH